MNTLRSAHLSLMLAACLSLQACETVPAEVGLTPKTASIEQLRATLPIAASVCSALEAEEVARRLSVAWERCRSSQSSPGAFPLWPGESPFPKAIAPLGNGRWLATMSAGAQAITIAEIGPTPACRSEVLVKGNGLIGWSIARHSQQWLADPTVNGPAAFCVSATPDGNAPAGQR
jgi:hypothetical protein